MSNKKERILIMPCSGECNCIRPVGNELYCGAYTHKDWAKIDPEKDCKDCSRAQYNGIPRSEAVKIMARIIFKELEPCLKPFHKVPKEKRGCIATAAEAALDSLLKV